MCLLNSIILFHFHLITLFIRVAGSAEDDDEPDYLDDEQCWSTDQEVSDVIPRSSAEPAEHRIVESEVSSFAVHKLSR